MTRQHKKHRPVNKREREVSISHGISFVYIVMDKNFTPTAGKNAYPYSGPGNQVDGVDKNLQAFCFQSAISTSRI